MTALYKTLTDYPWITSRATRDTGRVHIAAARYDHAAPLGPVDPARVSPIHLPALAHVAAELDTCTAPIRVVPAVDLGVCVECWGGPLGDVPVLDAVATVVATDANGYVSGDEVCSLHLDETVWNHGWLHRHVVVEVPAHEGRRWFERSDRETYYALDDLRGIAVVRDFTHAWTVVEAHDGFTGRALAVLPLGAGGYAESRLRAEVLAQAYASQLATDAALATYELAEVA